MSLHSAEQTFYPELKMMDGEATGSEVSCVSDSIQDESKKIQSGGKKVGYSETISNRELFDFLQIRFTHRFYSVHA